MKNNSLIAQTILLGAAITLFLLPSVKLPYLDQKADTYFSESMTEAGVAYGACRVVNAAASVIKETHLELEPAGVGVSLAAGQILDPIDDMTERASNILITSIVSLGVQKIAYNLCVKFAPTLIGILIIAWVLAFYLKENRERMRVIVRKSLIIIAVMRLCLPVSSIISSYLNDHYFSPEITKVKEELSKSSPAMERLKDMQMSAADGHFWEFRKNADFMKSKASDLREALNEMLQKMERIVVNLLDLSSLYVALFIVQVILLPLATYWFMARSLNSLFSAKIPRSIKKIVNRHARQVVTQ